MGSDASLDIIILRQYNAWGAHAAQETNISSRWSIAGDAAGAV